MSSRSGADGSPVEAEHRVEEWQAFDALLASARAGSDWAWRSLYGELAPAVAGYLRAQGVQDVDEVSGDVWLGVFRGIASFAGNSAQFRSWVFVIAHRRVQDERRRVWRRPSMVHADDAPVATVPAADDEALRALAAARVNAVLALLVPDQRDVLMLRLVSDLTVAQIAEVLDKSEGAVKALQRRGLDSVRRILAAEGVPL